MAVDSWPLILGPLVSFQEQNKTTGNKEARKSNLAKAAQPRKAERAELSMPTRRRYRIFLRRKWAAPLRAASHRQN